MTHPDVFDGLLSMPYSRQQIIEDPMFTADIGANDGVEIITIPERIADVIFDLEESAFVGRESDDSTEPEALWSYIITIIFIKTSLRNCADSEVTERVVSIQTAQGGTVMETTHVCLKTYYVRESAEIEVIIEQRN